ncbi:Eco57I restriction-modification methylase domain-containing protein [Azospirillum argentinense]|uniref:site-specific DNA-methyltransferase (adenine-specific) n=1 Tax=Azospirillum argentinense TaxID=2970906 RepID=A0A5B0KS31_9PROT|nr:ATP phosphoribosyltransferase regulatory subunit [Azospirillum argentinense]KAA1054430.1 Type IIG restriction enzyme/methyltransferase [Azospirillum argentinense]
MSDLSHHGEWLTLIDVSGPFLAEPVLKDTFPQGLEGLEPAKKRVVRQAYDEWREALDLEDADMPRIHSAWVDLVLKEVLELDEAGDGDVLKPADKLPDALRFEVPEHGVTLRPDYAVTDSQSNDCPLMLIVIYGPNVSLTEPLAGNGSLASPVERMVELCRATGVRLGLVTNGERWTLVDAPVGAVTSFASWYARLWGQEPVTLQAFANLLGIRRFFVDRSEQLPALLDNSLKFQDEVTDALGEQVRRAVEVLIQALDRADVDRNRTLLEGIEPPELYEASLTVMMRIVFLLSAEERGLLLMGDERYEAHYAVSTLRSQLRAESEEILERRWDAWSRLLAIFRAVYGGIAHDAMRLPALGGSLFDPDRFPFLEGRSKGSRWKTDPAAPLPIDNRTVLYLLDAVQLFQGRTLSYLALDIEQIGYVYEGLLERTVVRAQEVTLDLDATKDAKNPWVSLPELDDAIANGRQAVVDMLKERTGSSLSRIRSDLDKTVEDSATEKLLTACHGDRSLRDRIKPYCHLLRTDRWGYPLIYPKGAFIVTAGAERRETGTHYTPKSFTETIVKDTLEPLVYVGPAEGRAQSDWKLKPPAQLLDLKICDPAMGSGAFLVQVCRWLAERLVESWAESEKAGLVVTSEGELVDDLGAREPLHRDGEERLVLAKRLIAERCLYGVDMNPLAVELAKLSIWLVTLAKGRPFGFLDHNFRCGDSLLGITSLEQLEYLDMAPGLGSAKKLFAATIDEAVSEAIDLRSELRCRPIQDIRDVEEMVRLDDVARHKLEASEVVAHCLVAKALVAAGRNIDTAALAIDIGKVFEGDEATLKAIADDAADELRVDVEEGAKARRPFHWPLEFPEVFCREGSGFDAFVGNPPFLGGQRISGIFGSSYKEYLARSLTLDQAATADLVVFFFLRVYRLVRSGGQIGLLARRSIAEGKNREVGLEQLVKSGVTIRKAYTNISWPGQASVIVHKIHMTKGEWAGQVTINDASVENISAYLDGLDLGTPNRLTENAGRVFQGTILNGDGFKISEDVARDILRGCPNGEKIIFPFIGGNEVNSDPHLKPSCWVINFWDWPKAKAESTGQAFTIVENQVKPERTRRKPNGDFQLRAPLPDRWWQHGEKRPALYHAVGRGHCFLNHPQGWDFSKGPMASVIVISRGVTKYPSFTFLDNKFVFSEKLYVVADERYALFAVLSSDVHAAWAWSQKTSMGGDLYSLSYTTGGIFETFPFPEGFLDNGDQKLEGLGRKFYTARQSYMEATDKGLTKFYNDFHDPSKTDEGLKNLRDLQQEMNETVVQKYGWSGLDVGCGFHGVGYLPEGSNQRFAVSEATRLEILRRLSALNQIRSKAQAESAPAKAKAKAKSKKAASVGALFEDGLFGRDGGEA